MTNKVKLPSILALILILFLSLSVVSASEDSNLVTDTSDSVIDNTIAISDSNDDLTTDFNDSNVKIINSAESNDLDDEIIDLDESKDSKDLDDETSDSKSPKKSKIGSSSDDELIDSSEPIVVSAGPIVIDASTYSKYFDSNGLIKSGTLNDGDTIKIKSISNRVFTINKRLNIIYQKHFQ